MERRIKIVATLGPVSGEESVISRLLEAGVDVVRLNLSHGDHDQHRMLIARVRRVAAEHRRHVPVLFDLMGPRYRLAAMPDGGRVLEPDSEVTIGEDPRQVEVPIDDLGLLAHLRAGERVLIDNGLVELRILEPGDTRVAARVISGGEIAGRKGINLPDTALPFAISEKDRADAELAVAEQADWLAASYVGGADDLERVRRVVRRAGGEIPIVAKLERAAAVEHIEQIVAVADGVMVARGDLGVEVPLHLVPVLQKRIVAVGRALGRPVIVATQMLESMMEHPRPTRAESSDVANAVFDGADALMLSGETAAGRHPVEAVRTMGRIAREAEEFVAGQGSGRSGERIRASLPEVDEGSSAAGEPGSLEIPESVAAAAVLTAERLGARRIVAFSQSGFTARMIARHRPGTPIVAFTRTTAVARRVELLWGVHALVVSEPLEHHDEVVRVVERHLLEERLAENGDRIVIVMGDPIRDRPRTNLMRVHQIGGAATGRREGR